MSWSTAEGNSVDVLDSYLDVPLDGADVSVKLEDGEYARVQLHVTFPGTSTEGLDYQVLTSLDGGYTWDLSPVISGTIANAAGSSATANVLIEKVPMFKVQAKSTGATNTHTVTAQLAYSNP